MEVGLYPIKDKKWLSFLLEIRNDESTRSQLGNDSIFTLEECEKWFDTLESTWYWIVDNTTSNYVGYVRTDGDTVGVDIHPDYRRMGYARASYEKYLEDKNYASLEVFEDNFAKNLYEDIGFKQLDEFTMVRGRKYLKMVYNK
jgi:ribosomal protein S18 acetylase RimI-like enzyme